MNKGSFPCPPSLRRRYGWLPINTLSTPPTQLCGDVMRSVGRSVDVGGVGGGARNYVTHERGKLPSIILFNRPRVVERGDDAKNLSFLLVREYPLTKALITLNLARNVRHVKVSTRHTDT